MKGRGMLTDLRGELQHVTAAPRELHAHDADEALFEIIEALRLLPQLHAGMHLGQPALQKIEGKNVGA